MGDPPRYRVIDLGALAPRTATYSPTTKAFGLNNRGEVVGETTIAPPNSPQPVLPLHAFVWLPVAHYGLNPGMTDLSVLSGFGMQSEAQEINTPAGSAGPVIVGRQAFDFIGISETRPFVWNLAAPAEYVMLPTVCSQGPVGEVCGLNGVGYGVNDASPAVVVGAVETGLFCSGGTFGRPRLSAFRWTVGTNPAVLTLLSPLGGTLADDTSAANAINTLATPDIVGYSDACSEANACAAQRDAVRWTSTPLAAAFVKLPSGNETIATGANNAGSACGFGRIDGTSLSDCLQRALMWSTPSAAPFDLHTLGVPPLDGIEASTANAISNVEPSSSMRRVVGQNVTSGAAIMWESVNGVDWCYVNLNDDIGGCSSTGWTLTVANDVNDIGYVVGTGTRNGPPNRGFILACPFDVDLNGFVDGGDLGLVLSDWGVCPSYPRHCLADVNCSGTVDGADLGIVLSAWTGSTPCLAALSCGIGEVAGAAAALAGQLELPADPQQALMLLGFESPESFGIWADSATATQRANVLQALEAFLLDGE
ncbi:MAG: hypothetical protein U0575_07295 [Phycisphaerales bacterium]